MGFFLQHPCKTNISIPVSLCLDAALYQLQVYIWESEPCSTSSLSKQLPTFPPPCHTCYLSGFTDCLPHPQPHVYDGAQVRKDGGITAVLSHAHLLCVQKYQYWVSILKILCYKCWLVTCSCFTWRTSIECMMVMCWNCAEPSCSVPLVSTVLQTFYKQMNWPTLSFLPLYLLRSVPSEEKSFAIGIQFLLMRVLGKSGHNECIMWNR